MPLHVWAPQACRNLTHFGTSYCLVGHTHIPVRFASRTEDEDLVCEAEPLSEGIPKPLGDKRAIINPGSVGQPRDGDARASYAVLDTEELTLEYRRVPYDIEKTQKLMSKEKLPQRNIMRLSYGW